MSGIKPDAILIDDDILVRMAWAERFSASGKKLEAFESFLRFNERASEVPKTVPIFVDASLSEGERGEDVTLKLSSSGFKRLFLATGYPASEFEHVTWVEGVVGKEPPSWVLE